MSLSCLTCQKIIRTDSEKELREHDGNGKDSFGLLSKAERVSWSGNLTPRQRPNYEKMRSGSSLVPTKKMWKKAHHLMHSSGAIGSVEFSINEQPKLARSCGMRRDWSFEDLSRRHTVKA